MKLGSNFWLAILLILILFLLYRFVNKDSLIQAINFNLPPREAGLLSAMVLGNKDGLEKDFYEMLKNTGLVHIVVVSGTNVMLLAGLAIESLAGFFGRKKTIIFGLVLIWAYTGLVDFQIPIVRATLMISIFYLAQILGRKFNLSRALILTVTIMVATDWTMILGASFWLSLVAFVAVILNKRNVGTHCNAFLQIKNDFMMTLWVSLFITPILALVFGQISLIGPITNVMILGVVEIITLFGFLGSIMGIFIHVLGKILLWLIYPLLKYFIFIVDLWSGMGWISVGIKFNWFLLIGWYLILVYFLISRYQFFCSSQSVAGLKLAKKL
jgi:competence protein ComEC